jgi:hypothetical protein
MAIQATKANPSQVAALMNKTIESSNLSTKDKTSLREQIVNIGKQLNASNSFGLIDKAQQAAIEGGDKILGRVGSTVVAGTMVSAASYGAWDQAVRASEDFTPMVQELGKAFGGDQVGRHVLNAAADGLSVAGHSTVALAFAIVGYRAGVNWAEHVGWKATTE